MSSHTLIEDAILYYNNDGIQNIQENEHNLMPLLLKIANDLISGDHMNITKMTDQIPVLKDFNFTDSEPFNTLIEDFEDLIMGMEDNDDVVYYELLLMLVGISYYRIFLHENWTGPNVDPPVIFPNYDRSIADLGEDGETCYKVVRIPQYIQFAEVLLNSSLTDHLSHLKSINLWRGRIAYSHQQILSGPSDKLRKIADGSLEKAKFGFPPEQYFEIAASIELEHGYLFNFYKDTVNSKEHFKKAKEITGLNTTLSGAMGRRTRFQTFDTAQLVLLASSKKKIDNIEPTSNKLPEYQEPLDPELAPGLKAPKFTENITESDSELMIIDQCIILSLCLNVKNQNPRHGLTREEMAAYVDRVLKNPKDWIVQSMALLLKAKLDFQNSKVFDRACLQIETLIDQYNSHIDIDIKPVMRMKFLHSVPYPPLIRLQREMGLKWLKIGSAASAQLLFEKLDMWNEIIKCYVVMDKFYRAEELLKEKLETDATPELYCIYGDITGRSEHYYKAWELSNQRYSRAQRSLGKLHALKGEWKEAITHFQLALRINPQYPDAWYTMGCSALKINDFNLAATSFNRVVALRPDDGEAWNNLATAYIYVEKKNAAHRALKEACKFNSDSWRIWENFVTISMELKEYFDVVLGINRLLELKENYVDFEAFATIVQVVIDQIKLNNQTQTFSSLKRTLLELMDRIETIISYNSHVWAVYCEYYKAIGEFEKAYDYRMKQCRTALTNGWDFEIAIFTKVVSACKFLVEETVELNQQKYYYSTQLYLQSVIKQTKENFQNNELYTSLLQYLETVASHIKE